MSIISKNSDIFNKIGSSINPESLAISVLLILHAVGAIGLLSPFKDLIVQLTPLNLLLCFGILVTFHFEKNKVFYLYMSIIIIAGYFIEVIGVNTGVPFGEYVYGPSFGPRLFDTPFLIGINWFIMAYCGAALFKNASHNKILNAVLSGIGITLVDLLLEPVAIQFNFWNWSTETVPLQNYFTWTIGISIFSYLIYYLQPNQKNKLSNWVLGVQVVFFIVLLIGNKL